MGDTIKQSLNELREHIIVICSAHPNITIKDLIAPIQDGWNQSEAGALHRQWELSQHAIKESRRRKDAFRAGRQNRLAEEYSQSNEQAYLLPMIVKNPDKYRGSLLEVKYRESKIKVLKARVTRKSRFRITVAALILSPASLSAPVWEQMLFVKKPAGLRYNKSQEMVLCDSGADAYKVRMIINNRLAL